MKYNVYTVKDYIDTRLYQIDSGMFKTDRRVVNILETAFTKISTQSVGDLNIIFKGETNVGVMRLARALVDPPSLTTE